MKHRIQFDLAEDEYELLQKLAARTTLTEFFRAAIFSEGYLRERVREGGRLVLEQPNGEKRELVKL